MPDEKPVTDVMYRWWKVQDDPMSLIAIFPGDPGNDNEYTCSSFQMVGGHGACDPQMVVRYSQPASIGDKEVRRMHDYLIDRGYNLRIIERHDNQRYLAARRAALSA